MDKLLKKQISIGQSINNLKKIYLDTNFWIKIIDCKNSNDHLLLNYLEKLVETKKAIVPISDITYYEICKQSDENSLIRSAKIIDKLSNGISILSEKERRKIEFTYFVKKYMGKEDYKLSEVIWTKLSLNLFYPMLLNENLESRKENFIEFVGNISFLKITEFMKSSNIKPFFYKDDIVALNQAKEKYKDQNKTFNQMYLSELGGYLDYFGDDLNNYFEEIYFEETGKLVSDAERRSINPKKWQNSIYNLSKLKKLKNQLPSYHIFPEMNAAVRWNKNRKYKDGNDTMDFLHVSSALPYFDFFFTERELKTIIKQRKLDEIYNCKVLSNLDDILHILENEKII